MDNILQSVKKDLTGITEEYDAFDDQILMFINGAISTLNQVGVGAEDEVFSASKESTWDEYVSNEKLLSIVKQYIVEKVKVLFDPPSSSFVLNSLEKDLDRLEWRIRVMVDAINKTT